MDTSGAYEFPAMRALSISSADAFILVYDVTDSSTFEEARALRDQIHETKCSDNVPIVVVGNKIDLTGDREVRKIIPIKHNTKLEFKWKRIYFVTWNDFFLS